MAYAYSILMVAMAAGLLLYAAGLGAIKNHKLIPRWRAAKMNDPKRYAVQFAKGIAVMAVPFAVSGIIGLLQWYLFAVIVFIAGFIGAMAVIIKLVDGA